MRDGTHTAPAVRVSPHVIVARKQRSAPHPLSFQLDSGPSNFCPERNEDQPRAEARRETEKEPLDGSKTSQLQMSTPKRGPGASASCFSDTSAVARIKERNIAASGAALRTKPMTTAVVRKTGIPSPQGSGWSSSSYAVRLRLHPCWQVTRIPLVATRAVHESEFLEALDKGPSSHRGAFFFLSSFILAWCTRRFFLAVLDLQDRIRRGVGLSDLPPRGLESVTVQRLANRRCALRLILLAFPTSTLELETKVQLSNREMEVGSWLAERALSCSARPLAF